MDKNYTFRNFRTVGTLMQGLQIDNSATEKFSITRKLSMSTLMGEIKRVVLVKDKFEYREKLKCFRWKFRTIRILMKGRKTITFSLITRLQVLCVRLWSWWIKSNFWWLRHQYKWHFLEYFDCHESATWLKTDLLNESSSTNGMFPIEAWLGGFIPAVS